MKNDINTDHLSAILGHNTAPEDVDAELRSVLGHEAVDSLQQTVEAEPTPRLTEEDLTQMEAAHLDELSRARASELAATDTAEVTVRDDATGELRVVHGTILEPGAEAPAQDSAEQPAEASAEADIPDWVNGNH
ncbi:MAG TPA: hypothetical protein VL362_02075 [Patescibacteria group bacterium]|jgi:hypothetical protein|nr:hypothetical protein [Patescibacteria group bacterium]